MIPYRDALAAVLDSVKELPSQPVDFVSAEGSILARDLFSPEDVPGFDNSAMDGYALMAEETEAAGRDSAVMLMVKERLFAGMEPRHAVGRGEATCIMTGAPVPPGADAVVIKENTELTGNRVAVYAPVRRGENIRKKGEECRTGDLLISRGTVMNEAAVGMCALLGITTVEVVKAPRVAIIATGNELLSPREPAGPGKIRNANSYSLAALVKNCRGEPVDMGIARDTEDALKEKLEAALDVADVIITAAGISVGEGDLVRQVLLQMGAEMAFWKVAIRPGKPTAFGFLKEKPLFCLPGNPVSAMVTFEQFVRPALLKMAGHSSLFRPLVRASLEQEVLKKRGLHYFLRVCLTEQEGVVYARLTGPQGSGMLSSMVYAHGLMSVPPDREIIRAGEDVMVVLLKGSMPHAVNHG